jgi:hypothetical protein
VGWERRDWSRAQLQDARQGPTFEELINRGLRKGKSLDEVYLGIIGSARRSNAEVDAKYASGKAGSDVP